MICRIPPKFGSASSGVWDLLLKGIEGLEIARREGVHPSVISRIKTRVERRITAETEGKAASLKARQLGEIRRARREAWRGWEESCKPAAKTTRRSRGTGFGSGSGSGTVEQNEVKGQSGNLAFLDKVYDGIRLEARLTGTEAAQKQTVEVMSLEALVAGSIFDVVEQLPLGLATGVEAVGECSITNGAGIRRSARSVRPRTNGARAKRAWTPWKTAKDAVSHRAHTRPCPLKKTREDRLKQRSQPVHQIGSRSMEPSRVAGEPSFWTSRARNSSDRRPCTAFRISAQR